MGKYEIPNIPLVELSKEQKERKKELLKDSGKKIDEIRKEIYQKFNLRISQI